MQLIPRETENAQLKGQALPFFSGDMLQRLGLVQKNDHIADTCDIPYLRLYKVIVPPSTMHGRSGTGSSPSGNIAFNGFAYSLLNPTVAFVTAHWIAEYFEGNLSIPNRDDVEKGILAMPN